MHHYANKYSSICNMCFPHPMLKPLTQEFGRVARRTTICLVPSDNAFLSGQVLILNLMPYTYLQFLVSSCGLKRLVKSSWPWKCVWSPKEQERGHVWPLIHCIVSQKLILAGLRVLLLTGGEWMSEKLNMLSNVKLKSGLALWLCHCGNVRFAVDPGNRRRGASFSLRSCIQAHVCRW